VPDWLAKLECAQGWAGVRCRPLGVYVQFHSAGSAAHFVISKFITDKDSGSIEVN